MFKRSLHRLTFAFLILAAAAGAVHGAAAESDFSKAAAAESMARDVLIEGKGRWDLDRTREMSRVLPNAPEPIAAEMLWMAASAAPNIDTTQVFAAALTASSPAIRAQAAAILTIIGSPDSRRLIMNRLSVESNPDVIRAIVGGLATRPSPAGVKNLMDVMMLPNLKPETIAAAGEHLRRMTRTKIPDNPSAWRDWWLDNAHFYD